MDSFHTLIKQVCKDNSYESFKLLHKELLNRGVRFNYDPWDSSSNRIIFYTCKNVGVKNKNWSFTKHCNGLIMDYKTWKVLCYPPMVSNFVYNHSTVNDNYKSYTVHKAYNGTTVNLYHHCGKWTLSTLRGMDVSKSTMRGITFSNALTDTAKLIGSDWNLSNDKLDTSKSYTFGFNNPIFNKAEILL